MPSPARACALATLRRVGPRAITLADALAAPQVEALDPRERYRKLAFQYHPDRNPGNEGMMKELNEAYAVLSDQQKRREYDSYRQSYGFFARDRFRQTYTEQDIFRDSDINRVFEELSRAFGFSSPEDIFSRTNFYGDQFRSFQFRGPGFAGRAFFFFGSMSKTYQDMMKASRHQSKELPT